MKNSRENTRYILPLELNLGSVAYSIKRLRHSEDTVDYNWYDIETLSVKSMAFKDENQEIIVFNQGHKDELEIEAYNEDTLIADKGVARNIATDLNLERQQEIAEKIERYKKVYEFYYKLTEKTQDKEIYK